MSICLFFDSTQTLENNVITSRLLKQNLAPRFFIFSYKSHIFSEAIMSISFEQLFNSIQIQKLQTACYALVKFKNNYKAGNAQVMWPCSLGSFETLRHVLVSVVFGIHLFYLGLLRQMQI